MSYSDDMIKAGVFVGLVGLSLWVMEHPRTTMRVLCAIHTPRWDYKVPPPYPSRPVVSRKTKPIPKPDIIDWM
jgi:hypothetical protein